MVQLVIEGPDNSGKSTLGLYIAQQLGWSVQESEGKPRSPTDLDERCDRYALMERTIFVRHPVVSNPIYYHVHGNDGPSMYHRLNFYQSKPLLIYCDPALRGLKGHVIKEHDDPEFLAELEAKHAVILANYQRWALQHARVIYRIGDSMDAIVGMCCAYLGQ